MSKQLSNVSFRIDSQLKKSADELFTELGLSMTTAFNIFLRQSVREGKIPFEISLSRPNLETIQAMKEAEEIAKNPNAKRFHSIEELMEDLNDDEV